MKKLIASYVFFLSAFGSYIYIGLILGEWVKDGKGNLPLMCGLYLLRYFFHTSVKGGNLTGNPKAWQVAGTTIIDLILPFLFVYLLFK
jgi:hypothetical protein